MTAEKVLDLPLLEMAHAIRSRSVTSAALTEAALTRIARIGPALNCFVTVVPDVAREAARSADRELREGVHRGPLHGIPCALKDNIDTAGIRTTWGAIPYANRVPAEDATVVRHLKGAGAVIVGKLSLTEFAMGGPPQAALNGPCRNPWDTSRWTGGSSSGPAAAVSARLVAFALGTDTMGSLLNPAAFCGVTAFRPTYGSVSRAGVLPLAFTLDKVGPMCRTALDCAQVLAVIAGRDPQDPAVVHLPAGIVPVRPGAAAALRVGVLRVPPYSPVRQDVVRFYDDALATLASAGLALGPAAVEDLPWAEVAAVIVGAEVEVALEDLIRSGAIRERADPALRGRDFPVLEGRPSDYVKAMAIRAEMQEAVQHMFRDFDLLVWPNSPVLPPRLDEPVGPLGGNRMRVASSLAGLPTAAVPMGFVEPEHLPMGLAIAGPPFEDARVLDAAALYQSKTRFHLARPPIVDG